MPALAFIAVAGQSPAAKAAEAWVCEEARVLEQLARLTDVFGPWRSARYYFR